MCDLIVMSVLNEVGNDRFAGIFLSFTELDMHANMVVVGKQAFVFSHSGQYANVQAFAEKVDGIPAVPIAGAMVAYNCPSSGVTHLLVLSTKCFVCTNN